MALPTVSTEFLIGIGLLVMLVAVPLFVVAVLAVVAGYIQHDAEQFLEDLEAADGTEPVAAHREPAVEGVEPAIDDGKPAADGGEPVVDGDEPTDENR